MSLLEYLAVLLGLANVALIVRRSVWNYPFGIVMVLLYCRIFWHAGLLSDAGLQIFFAVVQLWGWIAWVRHRETDGRVHVETMTGAARWSWAAASLALVFIWGSGMARFTPASLPYWDGAVAMLSVVAQILMTQRRIENWWWWIAVNLLSIGLYAVKGLWPTAGLYVVFLAMAVWGLIDWQRHVHTGPRRAKRRVFTICLHGPESVGKTTLGAQLADHFGTVVVPEYGRTWSEVHGNNLSRADLVAIAVTHQTMTHRAAAQPETTASGVLIVDTDPLMTAVWSDMMTGGRDPWFARFADTADLYLLCDIDLPWVDDGLRIYGDADVRARFFAACRAELAARGVKWELVSGTGETRLANALAAIARHYPGRG